MSHPIDATKLTGITLAQGGHDTPEDGMCLMEAVAYVRGIPHTGHPACVAPLLGEMGRSLNDVLPDDLRQKLVPLIPVLPGTSGDGHDEERSYMALDWLIRTWLPTWLELSPARREDAARIRELGRIVDLASAERAGPVVRQAQESAAAARDAAWAAAWAAAWDAAGDAAWAAAGAAAWDAAGDAARAAAGAAAWAAAGAAAGDAAWAAAWAAARAALQPTVTALQESAIALYGRMARVGRDVTPTSCPQCTELHQFVDTLRGILDRFTGEQNTAAPEQPAAGVEQLCGHGYARLGGTVTRCVLPSGHGGSHDNGRGVLWAREGR